jgi:hypothetical protein
MRALARPVAPRAVFLALWLACGCADEPRVPQEELDRMARPKSLTPEALMVRFKEVKGTGFSRESWEVEVLQMGGDVRVRGVVRTGGQSVPVYRTMSNEEYVEFWHWLKEFPIDRARLTEMESAPPAEWRKTLDIDVVLGPEERLRSQNTWSRPLAGAAWVDQVEARLHSLTLDLAEEEIRRMKSQPVDEDKEAVREAVQNVLDDLTDEAGVLHSPTDGP